MKKPKVSVIVPIYNVSKYLDKCIRSVLSQTEKELELILIDDGSTDDSGIIAERFAAADNRVTVKHNTNQGVSFSRNQGVDIASADWIMFLDSDDWLKEDALACLCAQINDDTDIIEGDYVSTVSEHPQISAPTGTPHVSCCRDHAMMTICCYANPKTHARIYSSFSPETLPSLTFVWGKIYRKSVITGNGLCFDEKLKRGEDQKFNLELIEHIRCIAKIDQVIYFYRYREASASHSVDSAFQQYLSYAHGISSVLEKKKMSGRSVHLWNLKKFEIIIKLIAVCTIPVGWKVHKKENIRQLMTLLEDPSYREVLRSRNPYFSIKQRVIQQMLRLDMYSLCFLYFEL